MEIKSEKYIESQGIINMFFLRRSAVFDLPSLHSVLTRTSLRSAVLFLMDSNDDLQKNVDKAVARGMFNNGVYYQLGVRALSERNYALADRNFSLHQKLVSGEEQQTIYKYRIYLSLMLGRKDKAEQLARELIAHRENTAQADRDYWEWLKKTFGFDHFAR
jgi:hypothetical protein